MTEGLWSSTSKRSLERPEVAAEVLAHSLLGGRVLPLLGAGVSMALGLPNWADLVQRTATALGRSTDELPGAGRDLERSMDVLRRSCESDAAFRDAVRTALYQGVGTGPEHVSGSALLRAVAALIMTSARGSASDVLTLNLDDILEGYLYIHGFVTQVITELPCDQLSRVDAYIYHPHGFLPENTDLFSTSGDLVIGRSDYLARLAEEASSPWSVLLLSQLHSSVLLAVGTSMSDWDVAVYLERAKQAVRHRPLGFVLGEPNEHQTEEIRDMGMVPVEVRHDDLPGFLLSVSRRAAGLLAESRAG